MNGWRSVTIDECCEILDSKRVPINSEERESRSGNIPYYGANGLQGYIDEHIFDEPLILIAEDGGYFNEFATRPIAYRIQGKSWVNNHAHVLKAKNGYCQDAIFYALEHKDIQSFIVGGTRAKLNQSDLRSIRLILPNDPEEQIQIAKILSKLDQAIEQTEAIIAKQQRIKTGLMQDLLTKGIDENGNIRSEAKHQFKDSPLGRIPVEWEIKHLENVTSHIIDCPHTTPSFVADGFLVARTFNIKDGTFIDSNTFYVAETEFKERIARLEPRAGDIIFTREAPVGEAFVIPEGMRICLGQRTMLIRCNIESCVPDYLIEALYSPEMRIRFDQMVGGTTNPHLNVAEVRRLLILIPPVGEQKRIYELLATTRKALNDAQLQKRKFYALKTGLMHDLLTGKVRVNKLLES